MNADMTQWHPDGRGSVRRTAEGEYEVAVETPFTLWCPDPAPGDVEISFECRVQTANSAMLLMACARRWHDGGGVPGHPRTGEYATYAHGDLEMYTVGFNRTAHVAADVQPNAATANVRRIGGLRGVAHAGLDLSDRSPRMMARWRQWDEETLLCSAREPASGIDRFYHYRFAFTGRRITVDLDGQILLSVVDHLPDPLQGGYLAIRNMTPGAVYRIRKLSLPATAGESVDL